MKLIPDCIRDVLLEVENFQFLQDDLSVHYMELENFSILKNKYSNSEIAYTLLKLIEAKLIVGNAQYAGGHLFSINVSALTFNGHEYLEKIKSQGKWSKVKIIGSKVEDFSLSAIERIAEGVTSAAITKYFGSV